MTLTQFCDQVMAAQEFETLMKTKRLREESQSQTVNKKKDDKATPDKMAGGGESSSGVTTS